MKVGSNVGSSVQVKSRNSRTNEVKVRLLDVICRFDDIVD